METADLLAAAFVDDPLHVWAFPGDRDRRLRRLRWLMGALVEALADTCLIDRDDAGVAVWRPPEVSRPLPPGVALRHRIAWAPVRLGIPAVLRLRAAGVDVERQAASDTAGRPHWTLELVATDPETRGRGHGSRLVERGARRAAATGCVVYAVTHNPANLPWFRRRGFRVASVRSLRRGPRVWGLVCEPDL